MNLLLFQTPSGDPYPVVQRRAEDHPSDRPDAGWLERWKVRVQKGYFLLAERFNNEELVCAHLRHAQRLDVRHAARFSSDTVEKTLRKWLEARQRKHTRWLWVDAVLAILAISLGVLPGPNVFLYYPAIRSLGHLHARNGARNVLSLQNLCVKPEPLIDEVQEKLHDLESATDVVEELEKRYEIDGLRKLLAQLGKHES
jgi:hypothetical protein